MKKLVAILVVSMTILSALATTASANQGNWINLVIHRGARLNVQTASYLSVSPAATLGSLRMQSQTGGGLIQSGNFKQNSGS